MLSIILTLFSFILLLFLLAFFSLFLVRKHLRNPIVHSGERNVESQADWLTTRGILDSRARLGKMRLHFSKSRLFYLDIPYNYADIHVTYMVNGKSYVICPPMSLRDEIGDLFRDRTEELVAKYQSGKQVTVRYDPGNPQHAEIVMEGD